MLTTNEEDYYADDSPNYSNEFAAAYAGSQASVRRTKVSMDEVKKFSSWGFWVVIHSYLVYCPHTDAVLGSSENIALLTRVSEEATQYENDGWDDGGYVVYPPEQA